MSLENLSGHAVLRAAAVKAVFKALAGEGQTSSPTTRLVGGTVRNALLGEPVHDFDMATVLTPDIVTLKAEAAGLKVVPTGIEHGTVTVVANGKPVEVTTLRSDVETDGRHATVRFTEDWEEDAGRRDFTMNAIYCDPDGILFDPLGGRDDLAARLVRFIGDPEDRIREDYLRILRFFRFFAYYGHGRPDAGGLKACVRLKSGMAQLSAERIWSELKRLLEARDPARAMLWMRTTEVLQAVLPESWGIDAIHPLIAAEQAEGWLPDPILRLEAILPPRAERIEELAHRLKLAKAETARLTDWAGVDRVAADISDGALAERLYRDGAQPLRDRFALALAKALGEEDADAAEQLRSRIAFIDGWTKPVFPLAGKDLLDLGHEPGPAMGELLAALEEKWIESGFAVSRKILLKEAKRSS
ncbi:MAG TPA: CCA tRNA nucleotidyltransferase [Afifellaceae bacterium]|nr:CCA tRNA nucleotidyltransferase [Afifellaceae bacterium]